MRSSVISDLKHHESDGRAQRYSLIGEEAADFENEVKIFYRDVSFTQQIEFFGALAFRSVFLAASNMGGILMNGLGLFIAERKGFPHDVASLGMSIFMINIFIYPLALAIIEKVGISCSRSFGKMKFDEMKESFLKGSFLLLLTVTAAFFGIVLNTRPILMFFNLDEVVATQAVFYIRSIYFFDCLLFVRELLLCFLLSQGIATGFASATLMNTLLAAPVTVYLAFYKDMGIVGWIIGRILFDILSVGMSILAVFRKNTIGNFRWVNVRCFLSGMGEFYCHTLYITLAIYMENIGYEMATILVAQTKDNLKISAFSQLVNLSYIMSTLGHGFAHVSRSRMNYMIGRMKHHQAKHLFSVVLVGMLFISLMLGLVLWEARGVISYLYNSQHTERQEALKHMLDWYSILVIGDLMYPYIFASSRTTHQSNLNAFLNAFFLIFTQAGIGYYLIQVKLNSSVSSLIVLQALLITVQVIMVVRILTIDWKLETNDKYMAERMILPYITSETEEEKRNELNMMLDEALKNENGGGKEKGISLTHK